MRSCYPFYNSSLAVRLLYLPTLSTLPRLLASLGSKVVSSVSSPFHCEGKKKRGDRIDDLARPSLPTFVPLPSSFQLDAGVGRLFNLMS